MFIIYTCIYRHYIVTYLGNHLLALHHLMAPHHLSFIGTTQIILIPKTHLKQITGPPKDGCPECYLTFDWIINL